MVRSVSAAPLRAGLPCCAPIPRSAALRGSPVTASWRWVWDAEPVPGTRAEDSRSPLPRSTTSSSGAICLSCAR